MRSHTKSPARIAMVGLGLLAALFLLASPAGADEDSHSLGANASDGSVTSGGAIAHDGSTASGESIAIDGSTASGCSIAVDDSTASGGACGRHHGDEIIIVEEHEVVEHVDVHGVVVHEAGVAVPTHSRALALTGTSSGPLAAGAALLIIAGAAMVVLTSDRRRALQHS